MLRGMESSIRVSSSRALTMPKDALTGARGPLNIEPSFDGLLVS